MRNWSDWESSSRSEKRKPALARNLSRTSRHTPECLFGDQPGEIIHAAHDITPMCSQPEASQHPAEQRLQIRSPLVETVLCPLERGITDCD